jgi:sterol desaturase/sphingolipid hydroxylase (fatty acid hydroxylase superfamily)
MIPPTQRRVHPIQELFEIVIRSVIIGTVVGCYGFLTGHPIEDFVIGGVGLYYLAKVISIYPLQHSHIDLRLGVLETVMLSPAHHILHHSSEFEHWDKNYGTILKIWDVLHGTLVTPPVESTFRLGLPENQSRDYKGVLRGLLVPFTKAASLVKSRRHAPGTLFFRPPIAPAAQTSESAEHRAEPKSANGSVTPWSLTAGL